MTDTAQYAYEWTKTKHTGQPQHLRQRTQGITYTQHRADVTTEEV